MPPLLTSLPPNACDCHVHVFCPEQFPYDAGRAYTPGAATVETLLSWQSAAGIGRTILVQPSCYGLDNRAMGAALQTLGADRARGVAVVDPATVSDDELDTLHRLGVRGVRLNFHVQAGMDPSALIHRCQVTAARIEERGWHLQLHVDTAALAILAPTLKAMTVSVVLDHFGGGAASMETLATLLACRHIWMKLSAPYRVSQTMGHGDLLPLVRQSLNMAPDRLLWASDWPHTGGNGTRTSGAEAIEPFREVDVFASLALLREWTGDELLFNAVMVDNPARLYGFDS